MKRSSHASIALAIGALIIGTQIAVGVGAFLALPDWPTRGQFGDVFGAANALFSGLAFTGLIYTVFLQREELALQRKELELTRQELQRTARAQEQSEVALRSQAAAASLSARMSSASALLDHYRSELQPLHSVALPGNDPRRAVIHDLESKEQALLHILDSMYEQLTSQGGHHEQL